MGVIALLLSILILLLLPFIHISHVRSSLFKPIYKILCFGFISTTILLGYLGSKPIEQPYLFIAQYATIAYFSFFILLIITEIMDKKFIKTLQKI